MSAYRYVRVVCESTDADGSPLCIDVLRTDAGDIKRGIPYAGWWGKFKSTSVWPFIAKEIDGIYMLDFGSDESTSQNDRYELFNLLHSRVNRFDKFKLKYGGEWHSFVVRRLTDMIQSQDIE